MRQIPNEHAVKIRAAFGLEDSAPINERVQDAYWTMKLAFDRTGMPVGDPTIAMFSFLAAMAHPELMRRPLDTIINYRDRLRPGDTIAVIWRGAQTTAKFVQILDDEVLIDVEGEQQRIRLSDASILPDEGTRKPGKSK
jgi:hypothetical protein